MAKSCGATQPGADRFSYPFAACRMGADRGRQGLDCRFRDQSGGAERCLRAGGAGDGSSLLLRYAREWRRRKNPQLREQHEPQRSALSCDPRRWKHLFDAVFPACRLRRMAHGLGGRQISASLTSMADIGCRLLHRRHGAYYWQQISIADRTCFDNIFRLWMLTPNFFAFVHEMSLCDRCQDLMTTQLWL